MLPANGASRDYQLCPPQEGFDIAVQVSAGGGYVMTATVHRSLLLPGVRERDLRPARDGLYGDWYTPPAATAASAGIVVIGGAEGGLNPIESALLAGHGYRVLSLAYFGEPGLPATLQRIPLEYFERAVQWVQAQPGVLPHDVDLIGTSRGAEAALLVASHFPSLLHIVIARVPSDVALCGFASYFHCGGAAWTLHDAALPYTSQFNTPHPSDDPAAVIPVQPIHIPLLLVCAGQDTVWPSCPYAGAIVAAMSGVHPAATLLTYAAAGHGIGFPVPWLPGYSAEQGGSSSADAAARIDLWPRELAFLSATV